MEKIPTVYRDEIVTEGIIGGGDKLAKTTNCNTNLSPYNREDLVPTALKFLQYIGMNYTAQRSSKSIETD